MAIMIPLLSRAAVVALAAGLLGLVGCNDSDDDGATASATTVPPVVTTRTVDTSFTGEGSAELCSQMATFLSQSGDVGATPDPGQMRERVESSVTAIEQAAATAPAEIKPDVEAVATTFTAVADALAAANYDVTRVDLAPLQQLQSEAFLDSIARLQAYLANVCQIETNG